MKSILLLGLLGFSLSDTITIDIDTDAVDELIESHKEYNEAGMEFMNSDDMYTFLYAMEDALQQFMGSYAIGMGEMEGAIYEDLADLMDTVDSIWDDCDKDCMVT
jgi:hypothetical protein